MTNRPLFAIVHECDVPFKSPQATEIARIKREERWIAAPLDLSLDPREVAEEGIVYICGAYALQCVLVHFSEAKKARGHMKGTLLYEPATISITQAMGYF
jgi:hypothetical protein